MKTSWGAWLITPALRVVCTALVCKAMIIKQTRSVPRCSGSAALTEESSRGSKRGHWSRAQDPDILTGWEREVMAMPPSAAVFPCIRSASKVDGQAEDITAAEKG